MSNQTIKALSECQFHNNCGGWCETQREVEHNLCSDCLEAHDEDVRAKPEPVMEEGDTIQMELKLLDFALSFALCNMDHVGTRRDVKKAQVHLEKLRALLAQPALAVKQYGQDSVTGHSDVEVTLSSVTHYDHGPNVAEALARLACRVARFYKLEAPTLANPAEQHQGEPVAIVDRARQVEALRSAFEHRFKLDIWPVIDWLREVGLYTRPGAQPAPAAVVLPSADDLRGIIRKAAGSADLMRGANYYTAAELAAEAVVSEVARLNPPQQ
ncbi:hypothetical protein QL104_19955 [Pseudomonas piscis]|uniref:Uncharacterized protein n=1 Tax=Pseudomonas piscis TaxID=2614538 RepID=A0ABY9NCM3_9PSED|nr:hypothetical protein [Pseudomonas piscis]WMN15633.1 hypothetical protein QL104_19955 [Pseudomonas piscis]